MIGKEQRDMEKEVFQSLEWEIKVNKILKCVESELLMEQVF